MAIDRRRCILSEIWRCKFQSRFYGVMCMNFDFLGPSEGDDLDAIIKQ